MSHRSVFYIVQLQVEQIRIVCITNTMLTAKSQKKMISEILPVIYRSHYEVSFGRARVSLALPGARSTEQVFGTVRKF